MSSGEGVRVTAKEMVDRAIRLEQTAAALELGNPLNPNHRVGALVFMLMGCLWGVAAEVCHRLD